MPEISLCNELTVSIEVFVVKDEKECRFREAKRERRVDETKASIIKTTRCSMVFGRMF